MNAPILVGACGAAALLFASSLPAAEPTCRVIRVQDGDSLTCLSAAKQRIEIRLADLDAPEIAQPYGQLAQLQLFRLVYNKSVRLEVVEQTRYGPKVARVYLDDLYVNGEMVRQGAAWVDGDPHLTPLETEARSLQRGLWGLPQVEIVPPWQWRSERGDRLSRR
ncbi:Endonuclease YncB, thermonuclease family [Azotobacter beijerinckii]|uniref:Endonuclease YncB, thermonuclease family n=1 Tax=Azotobacter beijerinckii TaxID=170623 RepID=A0A1H6WDB0_9GAMM|nr:thermonuclease family protein [Azotobacter beijerinckii]SEJ14853.1 Endonuclease YncB, thermonuclease family [Azotobacter beijerinckii]SEJ23576.1 Endonuclease YncB, thermonuclease family [Azotobacter beijerinckii]